MTNKQKKEKGKITAKRFLVFTLIMGGITAFYLLVSFVNKLISLGAFMEWMNNIFAISMVGYIVIAYKLYKGRTEDKKEKK